MTTSELSPQLVARELIETLERHGDARSAAIAQSFFKERIRAFGLDAATERQIARQWVLKLAAVWTKREALLLCDRLLRHSHVEAKIVGLLILEGFVRELTPVDLRRFEKWLASGCNNWAAVDTLAPNIVGPLLEAHPQAIPEVVRWTKSPVMWVRRAAAVAFVKHARRGKYLDVAYRIARDLFRDPEDLIHKATGWLLREAGKTDMRRLELFLVKHGSRIPRTALRYAIERFPERKRKHLLAATRGSEAGGP
ncbi:MAG: DNA alkylation repair protein [Planctomycetota bacterium]